MAKATGVGEIILFGSGETAPVANRVYESLLGKKSSLVQIAILETPAGFQPNSPIVAEKVSQYIEKRLPEKRAQVHVIPARKRGTNFSPEDPAILQPLRDADVIFLGPGSPTYAVRQLRGSLAWKCILERWSKGATLILASAAAIAIGKFALPVYEIFKAGADLYWEEGLDLFGSAGLPLVVVPHWNNAEGGAELDTSRCFMGLDRFAQLRTLLPDGANILGLDEHTILRISMEEERGIVEGRGMVYAVTASGTKQWSKGDYLPLEEFGAFQKEKLASLKVTPSTTCEDSDPHESATELPPKEILELTERRTEARKMKNFNEADLLRSRMIEMGWDVEDTPAGTQLHKKE